LHISHDPHPQAKNVPFLSGGASSYSLLRAYTSAKVGAAGAGTAHPRRKNLLFLQDKVVLLLESAAGLHPRYLSTRRPPHEG
jgi:hypothetical protein